MTTPSKRLYDFAALVPPLGRLRRQRDHYAALADALDADLAEAKSAVKDLQVEVEQWKERFGEAPEPAYRLYPPGHFYSSQPDLDEVRAEADRLFDRSGDVLGIEVDLPGQLSLLRSLAPVIAQWPYADRSGGSGDPAEGLRYTPDNGFFGWTDGQLWYGLLRTWQPGRVVEIGSGWSTALLLDTADRHDLPTRLTCVEPYPDRLRSTMRPGDDARISLIQGRAQDVDAGALSDLEAGDVLFIDSTHVSKVGSDVNYLFFEVLPRLRSGVHVHVHDIAYPFEYPQEWVLEGRAWNEAYVLRALLTENPHWRIDLWPSLLFLRHEPEIRSVLHPDTPVDGGSLWLTRR